MTVVQTCDHHDAYGLVPSNRSRGRILEQLRAAAVLSEALGVAFQAAGMRRVVSSPMIVITLDEAMPLMQAWIAWLLIEPVGDDWAEAPEKPPEVRVPPDEVLTEGPLEGD